MASAALCTGGKDEGALDHCIRVCAHSIVGAGLLGSEVGGNTSPGDVSTTPEERRTHSLHIVLMWADAAMVVEMLEDEASSARMAAKDGNRVHAGVTQVVCSKHYRWRGGADDTFFNICEAPPNSLEALHEHDSSRQVD